MTRKFITMTKFDAKQYYFDHAAFGRVAAGHTVVFDLIMCRFFVVL